MFVALLPMRLAMARLTAPMRMAATETASSGRDVTRASAKEPKNVSPRPVWSARWSALRARKGPATRMTAAATTKPTWATTRGSAPPISRSSARAGSACRPPLAEGAGGEGPPPPPPPPRGGGASPLPLPDSEGAERVDDSYDQRADADAGHRPGRAGADESPGYHGDGGGRRGSEAQLQ